MGQTSSMTIKNIQNLHSVTIVTAWYRLKNKTNSYEPYQKWMSYFFKIKKCPIVVFTNQESLTDVQMYAESPNVTIVMKEMNQFSTWNSLALWERNAVQSQQQHPYISLELNLIWNEKVNFLLFASQSNLVNTPWVMWLDIGYFRCNEKKHMSADDVAAFPNEHVISQCNPKKIYIGCVAREKERQRIKALVLQRNNLGKEDASELINANMVAAGAFLLCTPNIPILHPLHNSTVDQFFKSNMYIKDDQTILTDVVVRQPHLFALVQVSNQLRRKRDAWMSFQLFLGP